MTGRRPTARSPTRSAGRSRSCSRASRGHDPAASRSPTRRRRSWPTTSPRSCPRAASADADRRRAEHRGRRAAHLGRPQSRRPETSGRSRPTGTSTSSGRVRGDDPHPGPQAAARTVQGQLAQEQGSGVDDGRREPKRTDVPTCARRSSARSTLDPTETARDGRTASTAELGAPRAASGPRQPRAEAVDGRSGGRGRVLAVGRVAAPPSRRRPRQVDARPEADRSTVGLARRSAAFVVPRAATKLDAALDAFAVDVAVAAARSTPARRPAGSPTACSSAARRTWSRSTSATVSSPGRCATIPGDASSSGPTSAPSSRPMLGEPASSSRSPISRSSRCALVAPALARLHRRRRRPSCCW